MRQANKFPCNFFAVFVLSFYSSLSQSNDFDAYSKRYMECTKNWQKIYAKKVISDLNEMYKKYDLYFVFERGGEVQAGHRVMMLYKNENGQFEYKNIYTVNGNSEISKSIIDKSKAIDFINKIGNKLFMANEGYFFMDGVDESCYRITYANGGIKKSFFVLSGGDLGALGVDMDLENAFRALK